MRPKTTRGPEEEEEYQHRRFRELLLLLSVRIQSGCI